MILITQPWQQTMKRVENGRHQFLRLIPRHRARTQRREGRGGLLRWMVNLGGNAMAQLIEPDGTLNIIVTVEYAMNFCAENPGWSWRCYEE